MRILIVEDDRIQRDVLRDILTMYGHAVFCAEDGAEADLYLKHERPDAVLLDVSLRDKSGFDICNELKANRETALIPVILVSGLSGTEDRLTGLKAGADEYLSKPFNIRELLRCIDSVLSPRD